MAFNVWTEQTPSASFDGKKGPRAVTHNGFIYLTGGDPGTGGGAAKHNDVWKSYDGQNWQEVISAAPWEGRAVHGLVSDGTYMYLFGGSTSGTFLNDMWRSADGETWEEVNSACDWDPRHEFGYAYMDGDIYVYGGYSSSTGNPAFGNYSNDVWKSSDLGETWTNLLSDTGSPGSNQWSQRREMAYTTHDNKIWCLGGDSGSYLNDVWSSSDGITWTSAVNADWSGRREHAAFSFDGKLWIVAGGPTAKNDTWYTSAVDEGWTEYTTSPTYTARLDTAVVFHNNGVYIIAGEI